MSQIQGEAPPGRRLTAPPLHRLAAILIDGATYLIDRLGCLARGASAWGDGG